MRSWRQIGYANALRRFFDLVHDVALLQPFDITTLQAPDGSVTAKFVSFGATLTELWIPDRDGKPRDIVLGYDNNVQSTHLYVYDAEADTPM